MPRKPTFGTPHQSKIYMAPAKRRGRFLACWIGVALVAVAVTADALTSKSFLVSPGSLSRSHALPPGRAAAVNDCARCHDPFSAPSDARCVGCHEPRAAVTRFANRAHTEQIQAADRGTTGARRPASPPRCIECHTEHQGRGAKIDSVATGECRGCHGFRSLGSGHPEFGILRLGRPEAPGIRFNHKRHLEELAKKGQQAPQACEACHRVNPGREGFAALSFDRDCASCHYTEKGNTIGRTDPLPPDLVVTVDAIAASDPGAAWAREYRDDFEEVRGRPVKKVLRHRDAWILYNVTRLAAMASGGAGTEAGGPSKAETAVKLESLRAELAEVSRRRDEAKPSGDPDAVRQRLADSEGRVRTLTAEVAGLDLNLAGAAPDTTPAAPHASSGDQIRASLAEIDAAITLLSGRTEAWAREEAERLRAKRARVSDRTQADGAGWSAAGVAARQAEVGRRLDDLAAAGVAANSIATLRRGGAATAPAGRADLQASFAEIDAAIALLAGRNEGWAREEADRLRSKRSRIDASAGGSAGAWSEEALSRRRAAAASSIDELGRAGLPASEQTALRSGLAAGTARESAAPGMAALRSQRTLKARALADAHADVGRFQALLDHPAAGDDDAGALDARRAQIENEIRALEALESHPAPVSAGAVDPEEAAKAIEKLIKPCAKCHLESTHAIARTAAARSVLPAAAFTHKPHLQTATCLECHAKAAGSEEAADLALDGVLKCRTCHNWRGAPDGCQTCHRYHPAPQAASVVDPGSGSGAAGPS